LLARPRLRLDVDREHEHDRPALGPGSVIGALGVTGGGVGAVEALGEIRD
jgi:hypothetical protein